MKKNFVLSIILVMLGYFQLLAQPSNDNPCSATPITVGNTCEYTAATNVAATNTAGVPAPGCASYSGQDVWFSFVVPSNGIVSINTLAGTMTDAGMALYSGSCSALTLVECDDDDSENGAMAKIYRTGLTPGQTMYVRLWDYGGGSGTFSICISTMPDCGSSPAAGNTCSTATPICDFNGYCGNTSSSYTDNSWSSSCGFLGLSDCGLDGEFCGSIENNSFLSFEASATSISFDVWVTSSLYGYGLQIFIFDATGGCSGDVTNYGPCYNPGVVEPGGVTITAGGLTVGQTYFIMIDGNAGDVCNYVIAANSGFNLPLTIDPETLTVCENEQVTLTAAGGDEIYTWTASPYLTSPSGATVTSNALPIGTHDFTVNSSTGNILCPSSTSATATITVISCGSCTVTASSSGPVCSGQTVDLFATDVPGATFSWVGPSGFTSTAQNPTAVAIPSTPGTYDYTVTADLGGGTTCVSTVTVTVNALPTVSAGSDQQICDGQSTTVNGAGASTYSWSGGITNGVSFTPSLGSNSYIVTGTSVNGCVNTDTVVVTVNANPTPVITGTSEYCQGSTTTLGVDNVYSSYTWSNGSNADQIEADNTLNPITVTVVDANGCSGTSAEFNTIEVSNVTANSSVAICEGESILIHGVSQSVGGTYSATFTTSGGCDSTSNVTLTVNALPIVAGGDDQLICEGASTSLNGTGASSYSWTGGVTDGVAFTPPLGLSSYTVTGTSAAGCENSDVVNITVAPNPTPVIIGEPLYCTGTNALLGVASPYESYSWSNGSTADQLNADESMNPITVTITDANGCQGTSNEFFVIAQLAEETYSSVSICEGESAMIHGVSQSVAGVYSQSFSSGAICDSISHVTLTVNSLPTIDAGVDQSVCSGESVVLIGSGASGLTWDGGITDGVAFTPVNGNTIYTVTGTDANGCVNSDEVTVTSTDLPTINAGSDQVVCSGESVQLLASGGTSYSWSNGASNGDSVVLPIGEQILTVTGTDANGCTNSDEVNISVLTIPQAVMDADSVHGQEVFDVNFMNYSTDATLYTWDFQNAVYTTTSTATIAHSFEAGTYEVILIATNGYCSSADTLIIIVDPLAPALIEIPNVFTPNGDGVNDIFQVTGERITDFHAIIVNRWGNVVYEYSDIKGGWDGNTAHGEAVDGVYFIRYEATGESGEEFEGHGNVTLIR